MVRRFNDHVGVMVKNVASAPEGAKIPARIQMKGIYTLSVDDPIWWDVASLENIDANPAALPKWLGDDETRIGIIAMLDRRCADMELCRLKEERSSLQEWYVQADEAIQRALRESGMYRAPPF